MKKILPFLTLLILALLILIAQEAFCQTVVTDPGAYSYFNGIDKKSQEQLGFLQKIQDANISIQSSLTGNKKIGYGINNSLISYDEYFQLRNNISLNPTQNKQESEKPAVISKNLDIHFPPLKINITNSQDTTREVADLNRKNYRQNTYKAAIIFAEMILGNSRTRINQITNIANDIDNSATLKEAVDINNRLILESIVETRNTNILLANLVKLHATGSYEGQLILGEVEASEDAKDLVKGQGSLGSAMTRPSGSGKFSNMTRR